MSELVIKREVRKYIRRSGMEAHPKMICSIVRLFKMKYGEVNKTQITQVAHKLINEYE